MALDLQQYKLKELSKFNQLILLDEKGFIVESCDSIFETTNRKDVSSIEWFPFLESVFPDLLKLEAGGQELKFTKMTNPLPELQGYFDFSFSKVTLEGNNLILWTVYDYTELYEDFIQYQQKRNELEIHRQLLERNLNKLRHNKDVLQRKNLELSDINGVQSIYYNKIKDEIVSPLNTLDGLTFILSNLLEENAYHQDYVKALRISTKHLQKIITELEYFDDKGNHANEGDSALSNFNVEQVVTDVLLELRQARVGNEIDVITEIDQNIPKEILGDVVSFRQIIYSLLVNVCLHEKKNQLQLEIKRRESESDICGLLIKVEGQNDAPKNQTFDIKGDKQKSENNTRELIIRLFIIKKLIELQNGVITINDESQNGTQVTCNLDFRLPV